MSAAERVTVRLDPADPAPGELRRCFAAILSELDARPRPLRVRVETANAEGAAASLDFDAEGRVVFGVTGRKNAVADFRRRWLADHPVPLALGPRPVTLLFEPVSGNRVRIRRAR